MPRDLNGNYSLPAGNPVSPNTVIEANWANTTMQDIAAALTNSLSRTGDGGMLAPFLFADGNQVVPSISWVNQPTAGWYRAGISDFRYVINAVDIVQLTGAKVHLFPNAAAANVLVGKTGSSPVVRQTIQILENGFSLPSADGLNADGDKFVFWNSGAIKLGLGLESGGFWFQSSGSGITGGFKWYGGAAAPVKQMHLDVGGDLVIGGAALGSLAPPTYQGLRIAGVTGGYIDFHDSVARRGVVYNDASADVRIEGVTGLPITLGRNGVTPQVIVDNSVFSPTGSVLLKGGDATSPPTVRLPHGVANAAPTDGDMWTTTAGMFVRINGVTVGPLGLATPAGIIQDFGGTVAPAGFLECDGAVIAEAAQPLLFAAIGHTWDTGGEGAGNFRLPNLPRRSTVGRGGAGTGTLGNAVGNVGGAETHTLVQAETALKSHRHRGLQTTTNPGGGSPVAGTTWTTVPSALVVGGAYADTDGAGAAIIENTGDATATAHNIRDPAAVVMKIIKT